MVAALNGKSLSGGWWPSRNYPTPLFASKHRTPTFSLDKNDAG